MAAVALDAEVRVDATLGDGAEVATLPVRNVRETKPGKVIEALVVPSVRSRDSGMTTPYGSRIPLETTTQNQAMRSLSKEIVHCGRTTRPLEPLRGLPICRYTDRGGKART